MKIYTSYFCKIKELHKSGIVPICIAIGIPRFFRGATLPYLAPKRYMLSDKWTDEQYIEMYQREVLDKVDLNILKMDMEGNSQGRDIAFCCYEKPGDFCHRHLLAEWLKEKLQVEVEEFGGNKPRRTEPTETQNTLF